MTEPLLTILTPTWNRRQLLPRLYSSLTSQTECADDIEWVVVDDGSTDGTECYLKEVAAIAAFPIKVVRQDNGGKHRALNEGIKQVRTQWLVIVDSDDWLLPRGLASALEEIRLNQDDPMVMAIISPRDFGPKMTLHYEVPDETLDFARWFMDQPVGDTSILMRSEMLRAFPFSEFGGEHFIAESSVWARAFRNGGIRLSNNRVVAGEYQVDGLSARSLESRCDNPLGCLFTYQAQLQAGLGRKYRMKSLLNYHRFYWHARYLSSAPESHGFHAKRAWLLAGAAVFTLDRLRLTGISS